MGTPTPHDRLDHSRSLGDPLVRREQALKATASSPPAVGSGRRAEIRGDTGAMVHITSRTSEQTARTRAPHGEARSEKTGAGRALGRRSGRDRSTRVRAVDEREGMPALDAETASSHPWLKEACAAATRR